MFKARIAIPIIGVIALSLMLPGVASANTASVKCDSTGVVFTYNADFGRSKVSTEIVNGVSYEYTVPVKQVSTHTWPGVTGDIYASASWSGGSIPKTKLHCPPPPPPPPPPAAPPPAAPAAAAGGDAAARRSRRRYRRRRPRSRRTSGRAGNAGRTVDALDPAEDHAAQARAREDRAGGLDRPLPARREVDRRHRARCRRLRQAAGPHDVRLARHRDAAERQGLLGGR